MIEFTYKISYKITHKITHKITRMEGYVYERKFVAVV